MNKELEALVRTATAEDSRTGRIRAYMEARKFGRKVFDNVLKELEQGYTQAAFEIEAETSKETLCDLVRSLDLHLEKEYLEQVCRELSSRHWNISSEITMIGITSAELVKQDNPEHSTDGIGLGVIFGVSTKKGVRQLRNIVGEFQYGIPINVQKIGRAIAH